MKTRRVGYYMTLGLTLFRPPVLAGIPALLLPGSVGNPGFPCGLCRKWVVVGRRWRNGRFLFFLLGKSVSSESLYSLHWHCVGRELAFLSLGGGENPDFPRAPQWEVEGCLFIAGSGWKSRFSPWSSQIPWLGCLILFAPPLSFLFSHPGRELGLLIIIWWGRKTRLPTWPLLLWLGMDSFLCGVSLE